MNSRELLINELGRELNQIKMKTPLVYHLTNTVTINDCANVTLAIGASPLMSFCAEEIEEIIGFASAVVINIGTMEASMRELALTAGKIANRLNKPVVLDPVGAGATTARKKLVEELLENVKFSVMKGNLAEIKALLNFDSLSRGVDSLEAGNDGLHAGKLLAEKYDTVAAITGAVDYIVSKDRALLIKNGSPLMGKVTGTGCMTASLIGSFLAGGSDSFISAAGGVLSMGLAGETAADHTKTIGTGSLKVSIIDNLSMLSSDIIKEKNNIEVL